MIKVLIIDDDKHTLKILNRHLTEYKYKPITSESADEGIALANSELPQIIIIDYDMKLKKAPEICKELRKNKKLKDTKILIFSDVVKGLLEQECMNAGAEGVAYKPTISDLLEMMEEIREGKNLSWGEVVDEEDIL